MRPRDEIELLSPAKNAEVAISAVKAGADAVYMGADAFGARAGARNDFSEVKKAADFAHKFGARLYIALNTILFDGEVERARETAFKACESGADALIIQDMGLIGGELPPIELHASTQCFINTPEKAKFLEAAGFDTLVLARELSLKEIGEISRSTAARIECFVHGALCVSYSGQCYLSAAIGGRSGNRGECAQPCRMKYSLLDSAKNEISAPAHYLSLKDMNRSASVAGMLRAGVSSFKIEGRLKDAGYVKNITAFYRQILDAEIERLGLRRSSFGISAYPFKPDASKSFNRGFCEYFLNSPTEKCAGFDTPKSKGEFACTAVKTLKGGFVASSDVLKNGDGILIKNPGGAIFGTRVNTSQNREVKCAPNCPKVVAGAQIWRNRSAEFEAEISKEPSRKIPAEIDFSENESSYTITFSFGGLSAKKEIEKLQTAQNFEAAKSKISESLQRLGGTNFVACKLSFRAQTAPFLKAAEINGLRRDLALELENQILNRHEKSRLISRALPKYMGISKEFFSADYRANVLNQAAAKFYENCGVKISARAPESGECDFSAIEAMRTKHCILRELGMCKRLGQFPKSIKEPLYLKSEEALLRLQFNCAAGCGMSVFYAGAR
ncbi:MAG: U32 family peptidase [Opitutales bacterium]|nr:U32 family peptidase [Opitutales bacterium]